MKGHSVWVWLLVLLGVLFFVVPLWGTFDFSLRAVRDQLTFAAYERVLTDPRFLPRFGYSLVMAALTIIGSILVVVPAAYWVRLRVPQARPYVEFITLLPFVVPAIVLVFGLVRFYSRPPLPLTATELGSDVLLLCAYVAITLPYMYRAVDIGLRSIDVRTLTEAAQSLGAGWPTIFWRVILPNLRGSILSGAFLTFTTVIGELTIAVFLVRPAFGPYMALLGQTRAYEPAALAIMSLLMTWLAVGLIQYFGRSSRGEAQLAGAR
ncbi:MAG: ABC transporter permease [Anaerolineae bacterium]